MFHIILYEPEIPPNTGNIIRLSVNTGFELHLIKPLGFSTDEKSLKRAGMDYIKRTEFKVWESLDDCLNKISPNAIYSVTTKGKTLYTDVKYKQGDAFIFGPESRGLPKEIREKYTPIFMPMRSEGRSLNLANAVAVVTYEAWRQRGFN
ncbi:MAG: tRNA (cytidine(34)-2'-O)-methyltransferase [Candidatus Marinimicrobia bacterium]|nr:tRNA (cytidine(34)-2'-O)-methyltransferase [Candidatus Neomarinimicrobiota bacterium]MDP6612372.1 tRNA (cytidine(34)-2'-O)-methyltransferase [Candidatus Neomarinimicrobiota bacterium]